MAKTTETQTPDPYIAALPRYIRAKKYAELSGISEPAQRTKRFNGEWTEGVHYIIAPDGKAMVNWAAVDRWCEGQ